MKQKTIDQKKTNKDNNCMGLNKDKIHNFCTWQNVLLVINSLILVSVIVLCFCLLKQQKYLTIQIANLTNRTVYDKEYKLNTFSIINLQALNFDRNKMQNAYNTSIEACKDYPNEGTGSLYICQEKYFKEKQKKLYKTYEAINNFCQENVVQAYRVTCMTEVMKALKNNQDSVDLDK